MKTILSSILIALTTSILAQTTIQAPVPGQDYTKTKVMLVGVFHFANPGLDTYKEAFAFDPLSEEHQEEIKEVVKALANFKPNKIGLEYHVRYNARMDSLYQQYMAGNYILKEDERQQLGFKLARETGLHKVHGIDVRGRNYSDVMGLTQAEYDSIEQRLISIGFKAKPNTKIWYPSFEKRYRFEDSLKTVMDLKEYLRYTNEASYIAPEHGIYLVDNFKLGIGEQDNYFGADMRTGWYNRNLRILHNIYRLIDSQEDRILIIIGSGHLPLLQHMIESSPELELVHATQYLDE